MPENTYKIQRKAGGAWVDAGVQRAINITEARRLAGDRLQTRVRVFRPEEGTGIETPEVRERMKARKRDIIELLADLQRVMRRSASFDHEAIELDEQITAMNHYLETGKRLVNP